MPSCSITGTIMHGTLPAAGVTVYCKQIQKTGEVQYLQQQMVATSDAAGLVTFDLPQSCIAYIEGEFQCGSTNFNVAGGVALTIPAASSATLESLSAAVIFPQTGLTVEDDGLQLLNPAATINFGTGLTATEVSPGVVLVAAAGGAAVTAEDIQDALVNFFPDVAPFDWTYDDAGDRVTLNILDATSGARGLMSTAYAARLDQLETTDAPTFAGLTLTGQVRAGDGAVGTPTYSFTNETTTGMYYLGSSILGFSIAGSRSFDIRASGAIFIPNDSAALNFGSSADLVILRDAVDTLAIRRATNSAVLRGYHTFTNTSNYQRWALSNSVSAVTLAAESAGTGAANIDIMLTPKGSGALKFSTDNTYDIGAAGATRPRNIYAATDVIAASSVTGTAAAVTGATGFLRVSTRLNISAPSDGVALLQNAAVNDFGRLQFGGTTSSFPALKRSTTELQVRLADDSGDATLKGRLKVHANAVAETPTATHTLRLFDAAGTEYKVLCVAA